MAHKDNFRLDDYEREILEKFERDELPQVPDVEKEIEFARQMARNTLKRMKRNNRRASGREDSD